MTEYRQHDLGTLEGVSGFLHDFAWFARDRIRQQTGEEVVIATGWANEYARGWMEQHGPQFDTPPPLDTQRVDSQDRPHGTMRWEKVPRLYFAGVPDEELHWESTAAELALGLLATSTHPRAADTAEYMREKVARFKRELRDRGEERHDYEAARVAAEVREERSKVRVDGELLIFDSPETARQYLDPKNHRPDTLPIEEVDPNEAQTPEQEAWELYGERYRDPQVEAVQEELRAKSLGHDLHDRYDRDSMEPDLGPEG